MEVHPYNEMERLYNVVVILLAMVTFSSFISSITSAMTHLATVSSKKVEQESRIRRYLAERCISHPLTARVWHVVRNSRIAPRRLQDDDVPILKRLPERLQLELRAAAFRQTLHNHALFNWYYRVDEDAVCQVCTRAMQ